MVNEPEIEKNESEKEKFVTLKFVNDKIVNDQKEYYDLTEWYVSRKITEEDHNNIYIHLKEDQSENYNYFGNLVETMTDGNPIDDDDNDNDTIPLPNVNFNEFSKIMEITELLKNIPFNEKNNRFRVEKPLMYEDFYENIKMNDPIENGNLEKIKNSLRSYIDNLNNKDLTELANATNYLNVSDILELICARIAFNIREMDEEQISNEFSEN